MRLLGWWDLLRQTRRDLGGYGLSSGYGGQAGACSGPLGEPPAGFRVNPANPAIWERKGNGNGPVRPGGDYPPSRAGRWS
jgi:hypothetical protein